MSRRQVCHCGHEKDTHYKDPVTRELCGCLGAYCECRKYVHEDEPPPTVKAKAAAPAPEHADWWAGWDQHMRGAD